MNFVVIEFDGRDVKEAIGLFESWAEAQLWAELHLSSDNWAIAELNNVPIED